MIEWKINYNTAEWMLLKEMLTTELEAQKEMLCTNLDPQQTAEIRGSIRFIKRVLNQENTP